MYKCRGCNMTTLMPLGSAKSDLKNMKFNLLSGPPVDKKCEHCGCSHLVSNYYFKLHNSSGIIWGKQSGHFSLPFVDSEPVSG